MSKSKIDQKTNHDDGDNNASVRNMKKKKQSRKSKEHTTLANGYVYCAVYIIIWPKTVYVCSNNFFALHYTQTETVLKRSAQAMTKK